MLLPEGQMGRVWEHSTDNALSKIVDHWTVVQRNIVYETLLLLPGKTAESGNIPQIMLFRKSWTTGQ